MKKHLEGVKVPELPSEITVEWLRDVLKNVSSARDIVSMEVDKNFEPLSLAGKAVRVAIGYAVEGSEPESVIVKFQTGRNNPKREGEMYQLLSEAKVTFIPRVYGTFGDGNLVLEDLSHTHHVIRGNEELTINQIRGVLVKLAMLNSRFWEDSPTSKPDLNHAINVINNDMGEENWNIFKQRYHTKLGQEEAVFEWMRENPATVAGFYKSAPQTMAHGDLHKGNLLFPNDGSDKPIFIDWQQSGQRVPSLDLLYFVVKELTVEQRRAHEPELLGEYYSLLPEHIRTVYTFDHLRLDYRACVFQTMKAVVMYVGPRFNDHPDRFEDADRMAERVIAAVQDLKPVEAIRELKKCGYLQSES